MSGLSWLLHFDSRTKAFTRVNIDNPALKSGIMFIYRDSKRRLWIGGRNGVDVFKDDNGELSCCRLFSSGGGQLFCRKYVNCVYEAHDGVFWIATRSGLYRFDESRKQNTIQRCKGFRTMWCMVFWKMNMVNCGLVLIKGWEVCN